MGYKWASIYCRNANFILKTDDIYININGLFRTVYVNQAALLKSVAGISILESRRVTNPSSKSYVSPQEYPFDSFPGLCNGFVYITSIQILKRILQIYSSNPFFDLQYVYIRFSVKELGYTFLTCLDFSIYRLYVTHLVILRMNKLCCVNMSL